MTIEAFARELFAAGATNLLLTALAFPIAVLLAAATAAIRIADVPVARRIVKIYVDAVRMTPLLLHLFFAFFALPKLGIVLDATTAAIATIGVHYAAYQSEILRAAYLSVAPGLHEASETLGMTTATRLRRVTFPLAIRVAIPPMANTLVEMFRGTSVVALVAIHDIVFTGVLLVNRNIGSSPIVFSLVAVYFVVFAVPATQAIRRLEKRVAVPV